MQPSTKDQGCYMNNGTLPEDAQKIWNILTPEAKSIILCPPPKPDSQKSKILHLTTQQNPPLPRRTVNEHNIEYIMACPHELCGGGYTIKCRK